MQQHKSSSVATGGHGWARAHLAQAVLGHGIRADPVFLGGTGKGRVGGDGGWTRQQTCLEKHLTAVNCLYIFGFIPYCLC